MVPISCDVDDAPRSIRLIVSGEWPPITELAAVRQQLISAGHLTDQTKALFDIRMVASIPPYSQVKDMVEAAMKQGGLPLQRAYLVGAAVQHGVVRQMQALAPPQIRIEIFTNEAEAVSWLSS
jgi:hypothetical protein